MAEKLPNYIDDLGRSITRTSGFDDGERSVTRGLPFGVQSHGRFSV